MREVFLLLMSFLSFLSNSVKPGWVEIECREAW
jgi:hypothetical protein